MASFSAGATFTDGVANDVTAAKLAALVNAATPTSGLIQDRSTEATVATGDTLLIGDFSDSNNLKRMTVANLMKAELTGTINTTAGTVATLTVGTTTSTAATITTGTIPTLTSTTKITSGTGTVAAPAISPTGDTNTGIFFPAADTIALAEGGVESMRIDSSGQVGIGTTSPAYRLNVQSVGSSSLNKDIVVRSGDETNFFRQSLVYNGSGATVGAFPSQSAGLYWEHGGGFGASGGLAIATNSSNAGPIILATADTERMRIDTSGNVSIGTSVPQSKFNVYSATAATVLIQGDSAAQTIINRASADTTGAQIFYRKSRGSIASPAAVATGDVIGDLIFQAFGGTNLRNLARVRGSVDAYVSDTDISSNLTFLTSTAGGVAASEKLRIAPSGQIGIGGANYGTSGQVLTSGGSAAAPSWTTINTTPADGSITFPMLSTSATEADNAAKRVARAWVNFDGTGTVAARASFNVSSITDITTGQYGINFTVNMSDANYSGLISGGVRVAGGGEARNDNNIQDQTVSQFQVYSMTPDGNYGDSNRYAAVVFR